jgi:hypothetical protein
MVRRSGIAAICAAAGLCLLAKPVLAQFPPVTEPTKDEQKCESNTGKTLSKFVGSKSKCVGKCVATARKTSGPYAGCFPPYADPVVDACITDPVKGAEAKAGANIAKKCNVAGKDSCPECYTPATKCTDGTGSNPFVQSTEGQVDPFTILVYCLEAGGTTPTKEQAKCEDGVSKALVKFVGAKTKCYDKCNKNVNKGKIAPGSCTPPSPSDPATTACIFDPLKGAEAKAAASIDKVCANVPSATPGCYGTSLDEGSEWVGLTETQIDITTPTVACGSPSGAFLD